MISHNRYLAVLAVLFAMLWVALAIDPLYRDDWAIENALVALFVIGTFAHGATAFASNAHCRWGKKNCSGCCARSAEARATTAPDANAAATPGRATAGRVTKSAKVTLIRDRY